MHIKIIFNLKELTGKISQISELPHRPPNLHNLLVTGQITAYKYCPGKKYYELRSLLEAQEMAGGEPHYRRCFPWDISAMDPHEITGLFIDETQLEILAQKNAKPHVQRKSNVTTPQKLTKVQQRVREVSPEWIKYANDRREQNPSFSMGKVITLIQKQSFGQHPSGTPFSADTIRKAIKHLFPSAGTVGRPPNK